MKKIDMNVIKDLGNKVPFVGGDKNEETVTREVSGKTLYPYVRASDEKGTQGDMMVVYQDKATVVEHYHRAIAALELKDEEERHFSNFDELDLFGAELKKQLDKTKLWNYAPERRDDVKQARAFLKNILVIEIPYGETLFVPEEEMEAFLEEETQCFGVAEYYYCVEEAHLLDPLREKAAQVGHTLEQGLETLVGHPADRIQSLAAAAIEKVPSPAVPHIRMLSA